MNLLIDYAMQFVGLPYLWGGDDPILGFDCSGLVQEILASAGIDPPGDQNAQALFNYFSANGQWNAPSAGALAFYGKDALNISHIAFMIDPYRILEAGSGGPTTINREAAAQQNAYIRVRLLKNRKDLVAVIKPRYISIGIGSYP